MHLLIAHNHGMEAKPDKHWMGHAALALPELGMILEAYADGTHLRQLSETSWPPSQDNVVIDHCQLQRLEKLRQSLRPQDIKEAESFWGPPHIYDKHHLLNAYSLTDGIARYQASLPSLAQEASYTVDDYAACYAKLVIAQIE
jgi:hypothetical protein